MSTCNRFDLQTLGSQPIMPKNVPDHCSSGLKTHVNRPLKMPSQDLLQIKGSDTNCNIKKISKSRTKTKADRRS